MTDNRYQISVQADQDLEEIYTYSLLNFGTRQADKYLESLYECFEKLASHPYIGKDVSQILEGAFRHPHRQHVVYNEHGRPLTILRIIGGEQDPLEQLNQRHRP